jgi:hypothetical protein
MAGSKTADPRAAASASRSSTSPRDLRFESGSVSGADFGGDGLLALGLRDPEPEVDPGACRGRLELDRMEKLQRSRGRVQDGPIRDVVVRAPVEDLLDHRVLAVLAMVG